VDFPQLGTSLNFRL